MQLFFTTDIEGNHARFSEEEARHCVQVLRKRVGDAITFIDGTGGWYEGEITETGKRKLSAKIISRKEGLGKLPYELHLAIAPTKNIDRMEWLLEKATEVGITSITPLRCDRSERKRIRPERLKKILLSATKQSLKAYLPKLHELTDFQSFIKNSATPGVNQRFIAHCQKLELPLLKNNCRAGGSVSILIGPEGDFSPAEIGLATECGFHEISLGESRLRTETAGLAAVFAVSFLNL